MKVLTYGFYEFLVDVGSALSLWLGLSIVDLSDLEDRIGVKDRTEVGIGSE